MATKDLDLSASPDATDQLPGWLEAAGTLGSALPAQIAGGIAGLARGAGAGVAALTQGEGAQAASNAADQEAASTVRSTQDAFTYAPRTPEGAERLDEIASAPSKLYKMLPEDTQAGFNELGQHASDIWDRFATSAPATAALTAGIANVAAPGGPEGKAIDAAIDAAEAAARASVEKVGNKSLAAAFTRAIERHNNLPMEEKVASSQAAREAMAPYLGRLKGKDGPGTGKTAPILGVNGKLKKAQTGYDGGEPIKTVDGRGIEQAGISLSPAYEIDGWNTCPNRFSCQDACLGHTAGNNFRISGGMEQYNVDYVPRGIRLKQIMRTQAMVADPENYAI